MSESKTPWSIMQADTELLDHGNSYHKGITAIIEGEMRRMGIEHRTDGSDWTSWDEERANMVEAMTHGFALASHLGGPSVIPPSLMTVVIDHVIAILDVDTAIEDGVGAWLAIEGNELDDQSRTIDEIWQRIRSILMALTY